MAPEKLTYDDAAGFPIYPHNKAIRWLMGQRANGLKAAPMSVVALRCTFGLLGILNSLFLLVATVNGMKIGISKQELNNVAKNLVVFSSCTSMVHKYFIFLSQEKGITRITLWMNEVKMRNKGVMVRQPRLEVFLRRNTAFFYYGGNIVPWILLTLPLLHGEEYCFEYPLVDNSKKYFILPLAGIMVMTIMIVSSRETSHFTSHVIIGCEVTYDAACLINMLVTFRSEVKRLSREWSSMRHLDLDRHSYFEQLKRNVDQHVELLNVFRDLKEFKNSMFGYQTFGCALTTCGMIYGCSKDTEFLREATSQVLPVFVFAIIEFILLCWLGEEITSGFQGIHRDIHMTNWYEAELKSKRAITVVLEFNKKAQVLTGFTVINATLSTFVETMKQSFSLFTLLQAIG